MERASGRTKLLVGQLALAGVGLVVWEWAAAAHRLDVFFFSRPSAIVARLGQWVGTGYLWPHVWATMAEAILSFLIGAALGIIVGFALAGLPALAALLDPYIRIANALPRVVLAPIFLLWFGLGMWSKVALGVTVVFFVVFFNTFRGVREVEPAIVDNVRMLGASRSQLIRHVLVPSALSWIFASLHVSIGLAMVAVVVGEYLGASRGVGYLVAQAEGVFDTTGVFAGMSVLAVTVLLVGHLVGRLERRLLRWRSHRSDWRGAR